ncbi:hypothetical protein G6O69_24710 [Pseudenhygromyxa sp. WMMC2535]|uniref:RCC1 domain-containing protein n=1 Tax=Pseudenhygromyxa sp. WMMC2535 TaxID=2712867 RepID=UPI001556B7E9|nr:hypothetical protein [Pseudenhygromyxa sp. WMMC2535]NVB41064.1 hypothetical protein [Pseudenhygromyxa sp. WMMC2535]
MQRSWIVLVALLCACKGKGGEEATPSQAVAAEPSPPPLSSSEPGVAPRAATSGPEPGAEGEAGTETGGTATGTETGGAATGTETGGAATETETGEEPPIQAAPVVAAPVRRDSLSAGYIHRCCVTPEGRLGCRGSAKRVELDGFDEAIEAVAAGLYGTCVLDAGGQLRCWGEEAPELDGDRTRFTRIAMGDGFVCGLELGGTLRCHGRADNPFPRPPEPSASAPFIDVVAGWDHACALATDGDVQCFGRGEGEGASLPCSQLEGVPEGVCKRGQWASQVWTQAPFGLVAKRIAAGGEHSCALSVDDEVVCWGAMGHGDGNTIYSSHLQVPEDLGTQPPIVDLAVGGGTSCVLHEGGAVTCWGQHEDAIPGTFVDIDCGASEVCGLRASGELECFAHSRFVGVGSDERELVCRTGEAGR